MPRKPWILALLLPFSILSAWAVYRHGVWGIFEHQFVSAAGLQVLADLAIALTLWLSWMWPDARRLGRNPWPWLAATLLAGSFGPLLYLLTRRDDGNR